MSMASSQLDRIVKGAPPPNVSPEQVASAARSSSRTRGPQSPTSITAPLAPALDPVSHLPSSPPQIYLNLLILEASLRAQYLSLRARLRLHILLLGALLLWTAVFTYLLFLRPREDGSGSGGSVYWVVDMGEKMGFVGGAVTWGLVWGTGVYDRGFRWPRKWVSVTNRGLRGFNMKVVVIRGSLWREALGYLGLLGPFGYWAGTKAMSYRVLPRDIERVAGGEKEKLRRMDDMHRSAWVEEDVAPGGDTIKLLLLPKPFSPDFREDWDTFRTAYWEKENDRRQGLRALIKAKERETAKKEGGWLWWTGWRGWRRLAGHPRAAPDPRRLAPRSRPNSMLLKEKRRELGEGHSRSSSRSSTPGAELDMRTRRQTGAVESGSRRTSSTQGSGRRKRAPSNLTSTSRPSSRIYSDGRPVTPDSTGSLTPMFGKRFSTLSSGSASEWEGKKEETPPPPPSVGADVEIKQEKSS